MCNITGIANIFSEMCAFVYIVWFSYLVKRMVTNPTSNFRVLTLLAHAVTITIAVSFVLIINFTLGFGLSVIFMLIHS